MRSVASEPSILGREGLQSLTNGIVIRLPLDEHQATMTDLACCIVVRVLCRGPGAPQALPSTGAAVRAVEAGGV